MDDYSIPPWNMIFDHMTSMVDWCEPNYMQTSNVAEPANTASNIPFYLYALLEAALFRRYSRHMGCANIAIWILLLTVGISSTIFHATLSFGGQVLDQLSILWLIMAAACLWLPARLLPAPCRASPRLTTGLLLSLAAGVSLFAWRTPAVYGTVVGLLGVPVTLALLAELRRCDSPRAYRLGVRTMALSVAAGACWQADRFLCETWLVTQAPYLHAIWHVLSAVSGTNLLVLFAYFDALARTASHSDVIPLLSYWPRDNTTWECLNVPYVQIAYRSLVRKRVVLSV